MQLEFESLKNAIASLRRSVAVAEGDLDAVSDDMRETIRAGVIQHFEVAYEQSWKMMKRWLEGNLGSAYVDGVSRNELFRLAAESQLIEDVTRWMDYHKARNRTSHTYDEETAESVFESASSFLGDAEKLLIALESRNA